MKPKFSLIIPVYNVATYLRECLDSLLVQTYPVWEAICVDDGSTDGSGVIIDEYAARDSRFRVIHQANAGVSAARNAALDVAQGEWIGFVDADDVLKDEWLQRVVDLIKEFKDIDWIRMAYTECYSDMTVADYKWKRDFVPARYVRNKDVMPWGYEIVLRMGGEIWKNFYAASILKGIRFRVGIRYCEDALFTYHALPKVRAAGYCDYDGYIYRRWREGAATNKKDSIDEANQILAIATEIWNQNAAVVDESSNAELCRISLTQFLARRVLEAWGSYGNSPTQKQRKLFKTLIAEYVKAGAYSDKGLGAWGNRIRWVLFAAFAEPIFIRFSMSFLKKWLRDM